MDKLFTTDLKEKQGINIYPDHQTFLDSLTPEQKLYLISVTTVMSETAISGLDRAQAVILLNDFCEALSNWRHDTYGQSVEDDPAFKTQLDSMFCTFFRVAGTGDPK